MEPLQYRLGEVVGVQVSCTHLLEKEQKSCIMFINTSLGLELPTTKSYSIRTFIQDIHIDKS